MAMKQRFIRWVLIVLAGMATACTSTEKTPAGMWDATITTAGGLQVPFKFEIAGAPPQLSATTIRRSGITRVSLIPETDSRGTHHKS